MAQTAAEIKGEVIILNDQSTLTQYSDVIEAINRHNGWFEDDKTMGDDIALLHSEVSEMFEEHRSGYADNYVYHTHDKKCHSFPGQKAEYEPTFYRCCVVKPEGVPTEAADLAIRLLDFCRRRGIDLDFEIRRKLEYNLTRGYKHGGKVI